MSCGDKFLYLRRQIKDRYFFAFIPSRCKSWSCSTCRPIKANIVRNYIKENFYGDNLYMMTLTFFHSGSALKTWENLGKCWNRMRTYIAKKYGPFKYIRIVEPHKEGGWPHLHILIDGFVCDEKVVKQITKWGFGWNMHNQRISPKDASRYLSKYLTKEWPRTCADVFRAASKARVVSVSRGMPAIFTTQSEWTVVQRDWPGDRAKFMLNALIKVLKDKGADVILAKPFSDGFILETDVYVQSEFLENFPDPYVWEVCDNYDFAYFPLGLQQEILFGDL